MTMYYVTKSTLIFDKEFTIEMWLRLEEDMPTQNYYLF